MRLSSFSLAFCALLLFSACEEPIDPLQAAQAQQASLADSLLLSDFHQQVQHLQQAANNPVSVLPLAEQIARLPQPLQQRLLVSQPDTSNSNLAVDTVAAKELWVENAAMLIAVREYEAARQKIQNLAAQNDALITGEAEKFSEDRLQNTFTIQVPVKNYTIILDAFREMAMVLREKTTWREDLSVSWTDVQARLDAKNTAETRLQEMLKSAKSTEILAVQRELDVLREEMQTLHRTAQLLRQKTIYSTVTLTIYQDASRPAPAQAGFGEQVSTNAKNGWSHFKNTIIKLSTYWVYISIGALFFIVAILSSRRARRLNAQNQQIFSNQQQWLNQNRRGQN